MRKPRLSVGGGGLLHGFPSPVLLFLLLPLLSCWRAAAQAQQAPQTDPVEERLALALWTAAAVNAILSKLGLSAPPSWNISGNPCSGAATDDTSIDDNPAFNPAIKCDCSDQNNTLCHVTRLKINTLDAVGPIPEELRNLTHLVKLDFRKNYFYGPLPAFIGELTALESMTVGINALSGPVPKELGNLTNLLSLALGSNNFNGTLPDELGKLTKLRQIYIDSNDFSGPLPSTLSQLKNLSILWASDNNFSGQIPDYLGSLTNLTQLRLQGNSFQGPIPTSLSNLVNLKKLRIGDIVNGSSSLSFIGNLTSLGELVLRNSIISDTLASVDFSNFVNLYLLDLSFNNITGQIPQSILNLPSLSYLFLGNNSLSGSLPATKSPLVTNIYLFLCLFTEIFHTTISQETFLLGLLRKIYNCMFVFSNFFQENILLSYCTQNLPIQYNILASNQNLKWQNISSAVFCHGDWSVFSIVLPVSSVLQSIPIKQYSENLDAAASFAVDCGGSRAISGSDNSVYQADNANLSAASYYVAGAPTWAVSSVGLFLDADAPNASYIIYSSRQFENTLDSALFQTARMSPSSLRYYGIGLENGNYTVTLQFAEVDFPDMQSWRSRGRRVFDIYVQGERKEQNFDIRKAAGGKSFTAVKKQYVVPVTKNFLEIHLFWAGKGTCCIPYKGYYGPAISALSATPNFVPTVRSSEDSKSSHKTGVIAGVAVGVSVFALIALAGIFLWCQKRRKLLLELEELYTIVGRPNVFSYSELRSATENFCSSNLLGEGGYGSVYKGKLSDGKVVAVKQLSQSSNQGKMQFAAEIETISRVQHRNLLVVSSTLLSSSGYLAPEYAMRGHMTEKVDVFAFGVVALEIVAGESNYQNALDEGTTYIFERHRCRPKQILEWYVLLTTFQVWELYENGRPLEFVDPKLTEYDAYEVLRVIRVALHCTQGSPHKRPSMSRVVAMLNGDADAAEDVAKPSYITEWQVMAADVSGSFASSHVGSSSTQTQPTSSSGGHGGAQASPEPGDLTPAVPSPLYTSIIEEGR
ncbi:putative LRR receptor-like serine/threonine-protein kinase [Zea mays]|uniref:non-specific serine/threonine protein kinase n=1 Tax=Zea mays TaxID=4577 RepID=A0A3L6FVE6_MAIZE|nr:putative LRR receptor-like serine/threonine-protein kinase [Zea mays]